jgi:hypothetical protein
MTPQSSVNFPKIDLKTALNSAKQYRTQRVMRAVFAVQPIGTWLKTPLACPLAGNHPCGALVGLSNRKTVEFAFDSYFLSF